MADRGWRARLVAALLLQTAAGGAAAVAQVVDPGKPVVQIGTADDDSTQVLFGAWSVGRLSDGSIVIGNTGTNQLRVFDARGKYKATIGRKGGGPGEFTGLQYVDVIRGDTIVTYDVFQGRISWFNANGKVARTVQVKPLGNVLPRAVGFLQDGRMVGRSDFDRQFGSGLRRDSVTFVLYDVRGEQTDTLGRYAGDEQFFIRTPDFATRRAVIFGRGVFGSARGGRIAIGSNDAYHFDLFDANGRRTATVNEPSVPVKVKSADVAASNKAWLDGMQPEQRSRMEKLVGQFPASPTYAAYQDLVVGRDGSIWSGDVAIPGRPRIWTIHPAGGAPKRQLRLPTGSLPLDAGADYVLTRIRDDLGVEYIKLYRLPAR